MTMFRPYPVYFLRILVGLFIYLIGASLAQDSLNLDRNEVSTPSECLEKILKEDVASFQEEENTSNASSLPTEDIYRIKDFLYLKSSTVWDDLEIFVCWENFSENTANERLWVQEIVQRTWEQKSALTFAYWGECDPKSIGIRISIQDTGPYTKGLGIELNGVQEGMILNFSFKQWGHTCQVPSDHRRDCIESIAVHEFGHALGFAHEHNRPDTPGECAKSPQGSNGNVELTPYDPDSVMNYCNLRYNNNGMLSDLDVKGLQCVYGIPEEE